MITPVLPASPGGLTSQPGTQRGGPAVGWPPYRVLRNKDEICWFLPSERLSAVNGQVKVKVKSLRNAEGKQGQIKIEAVSMTQPLRLFSRLCGIPSNARPTNVRLSVLGKLAIAPRTNHFSAPKAFRYLLTCKLTQRSAFCALGTRRQNKKPIEIRFI